MSAPLLAETSEDNVTLIKGFASTDLLDRTREFVDPTSFDIPTFLNSPTLLRNHKFITDKYGNERAAGRVTMAVPAIIREESPENPLEWVVRAIETDEFVSTWPKSKSPNMLIGDRGLFVIAEVTHPEVIAQVLSGELGGFSWKGYSQSQQCANGICELKAIDLVEITVCNMPCQSQSTLMVTSMDDPNLNTQVSLKDCSIYKIQFDKHSYNLEDIKEYTKSLNTDTHSISENSDSFFLSVGESSLVDATNSFSIRVGDRNLIAAPKKKTEILEVPYVGAIQSTVIEENKMDQIPETQVAEVAVPAVKLFLLDLESLQAQIPGVIIAHSKSTILEDVPVEMHTLLIPEAAEEAPAEEVVAEVLAVEEVVAVEPVAETVEEVVAVEDVVEEVVAVEVVAEESEISKLTAVVIGLSSKLDEAIAKNIELEGKINQSVNEVSTSVEKKLEAYQKSELASQRMEEQESKLNSLFKLFATETPTEEVRGDKVEAVKSAPQDDVIFGAYNSLFTIKGVN